MCGPVMMPFRRGCEDGMGGVEESGVPGIVTGMTRGGGDDDSIYPIASMPSMTSQLALSLPKKPNLLPKMIPKKVRLLTKFLDAHSSLVK